MLQQQRPTLTAIFSDVLANLAFMFIDESQAEPPPGPWLETSIQYQGAVRGRLSLCCPREFSETLAANLLGVDSMELEGAGPAEDAIRELLNVVCGQFVTARYGTETVFHLSIPEVRPLGDGPPGLTADGEQCELSVEGQPVRLAHTCENNAGEQS